MSKADEFFALPLYHRRKHMAITDEMIQKATEEMQEAFAIYMEKYLTLKRMLDEVSGDEEEPETEEDLEEEDEPLTELEEREYWRNVLNDELKRWNK